MSAKFQAVAQPLKNQKWELYCQGVAQGLTVEQAVVSAGFSPNGATAAGARLNRDPRVKARIAELKLQIVRQLEQSVSPPNIQARQFVRQQVQERAYRLAKYQDIVDRIELLMTARAEQHKDVAGGASGLLVEQRKTVGTGPREQIISEFVVDRSIITELREYLKQSSIEAGDWEEAHRIVAPQGEDLSHLTPEQLFAEQRVLLEARAKIEALRSGQAQPLLIDAAAGSVEEVKEPGKGE